MEKVINQLKNVDGRFLIETPFIFLLIMAYKEVVYEVESGACFGLLDPACAL